MHVEISNVSFKQRSQRSISLNVAILLGRLMDSNKEPEVEFGNRATKELRQQNLFFR